MGGTRVVDSQEIICPGNETAFFIVVFMEKHFPAGGTRLKQGGCNQCIKHVSFVDVP